ncbi:hypothetical protein Rhe02_19790 [Rhizocola hellebori]|uniref:Protein kinase domain-containing protein n=1 Tax=Rhizocola hellebori TaxID=1392758 RepID=A0A8J3VF93_9ACTN|nr:aminoglycoside phosphotransferase family protein [Rhizocola hellebori]GIH03912.1 hypothetical protein Rhe02_19790 [Rhizocola hellebori]
MEALPPATGSRRITWADLPAAAASGIESMLGSKVVDAASQSGGFSDGLAARLVLENGRRVFVKAINASTSPHVGRFHRRERAVSSAMPAHVAVPRLLDAYDDGQWVALAFQDIEGRLPAQPWQPEQLQRILAAAGELAAQLTPAPDLVVEKVPPRLGGWHYLVDSEQPRQRLAEVAPWAHQNLQMLLALEQRLDEAIAGETLLHGDLYPFNVLVSDERVFFVDWPHAWVGAGHVDVVTLLISAGLSGIDPQPLLESLPLTAAVDPSHIDVQLAAHSGFLLATLCYAGPDADPHLMAMMKGLGMSSLRWLARRRST